MTAEECGCKACRCPHEWGPKQLHVGPGGPLDGEWIVQSCLWCNTGTIRPRSGGPCIDLIIAAIDRANENRRSP